MARIGQTMQITPVDNENNLFKVENAFPQELVDKVMQTPWLDLEWDRQEGQESWPRRRIRENSIPWINEWHTYLIQKWQEISKTIGVKTQYYYGTAFWLDEPGFVCSMHTDGELPSSLHLTWFGSGTTFYWYNDPDTVRYQVPSQPNAGYIMVNQLDEHGYRRLLWHAMPTPVPENSFRLTTYSWIIPK